MALARDADARSPAANRACAAKPAQTGKLIAPHRTHCRAQSLRRRAHALTSPTLMVRCSRPFTPCGGKSRQDRFHAFAVYFGGMRNRFDAERLLPAAKKYPGKIAVLGEAARSSMILTGAHREMRFRCAEKFRERAEAILAAGAVGFGEMSAEHFPSTPISTLRRSRAVLLLADVAAQHDVPSPSIWKPCRRIWTCPRRSSSAQPPRPTCQYCRIRATALS